MEECGGTINTCRLEGDISQLDMYIFYDSFLSFFIESDKRLVFVLKLSIITLFKKYSICRKPEVFQC